MGAIQKRATNIGETLNKACAALEEQNSTLEGILAGIDYNDERKLGDARNRDTVPPGWSSTSRRSRSATTAWSSLIFSAARRNR